MADALSKDAKELKKRVSDGKPSSAQARAVIDAANKLDGYLAPVEITTLSGVFRTSFGMVRDLPAASQASTSYSLPLSQRRISSLASKADSGLDIAPVIPVASTASTDDGFSVYAREAWSGYAVLRGEKAPDDALARELGAMGLL